MNEEEYALMNLTDIFEDWKPDDSDFLNDSTETADEIHEIEDVLNDDEVSIHRKISMLYHFNLNWRPDEAAEEDDFFMKKALKLIKNNEEDL